jgi:threonine/homoserine/homoserine lactone efflux protein
VDLQSYLAFVGVAVVVILAPGADFAVVTRNTLVGGRGRGWATALGITASNLVQGAIAVAGLGALVVAGHTLFTVVKWAGAAYLVVLAVQALRSAVRGEYAASTEGSPTRGFRQGFLTNVTNPKILVFYLAVLPQFIAPTAPVGVLGVLAVTHALLSLVYLVALVAVLDRSRRWLTRRPVRRALDAFTGAVFGALAVRLALD